MRGVKNRGDAPISMVLACVEHGPSDLLAIKCGGFNGFQAFYGQELEPESGCGDDG